MYICVCNPFSDKDVQSHFDAAAAQAERVTLNQTYAACSGGEPINGDCHKCVQTLAGMVKDHNSKIIPVAPVPDSL